MTLESAVGYLIQLVSAVAVLYVSYRILQLKVWFKDEMTKVVKENCASKSDFAAHVKADELFQNNLTDSITEKRAEYAKHHTAHYAHAANTGIHQESMSSVLLQEKFENVKSQVAGVQARVEQLSALIERNQRG